MVDGIVDLAVLLVDGISVDNARLAIFERSSLKSCAPIFDLIWLRPRSWRTCVAPSI